MHGPQPAGVGQRAPRRAQAWTGTVNAHRAHRGLGRTFQRMELSTACRSRERAGPDRRHTSPARVRSGSSTSGEGNKGGRAAGQRRHGAVRHHPPGPQDGCRSVDRPAAPGRAGPGDRHAVQVPAAGRAVVGPGSSPRPTPSARCSPTMWRESGVGILIVEHDMALVAEICERIYVLDFGKIIYEGTTEEAPDSDLVRAAYLGEVDVCLSCGTSPPATTTGTVLRDVEYQVPDGAVVGAARPQRSRQDDTAQVRLRSAGTAVGPDPHRRRGRHQLPAHQLARRGVCHVPEGRGIFPSLTVADNIRLQAPPRRSKASSAMRPRFPAARRTAPSRSADDERRRAADAGAGPRLRRRTRRSSCSTRCRWASHRRSSTRSSSTCTTWRGSGDRCCSWSST